MTPTQTKALEAIKKAKGDAQGWVWDPTFGNGRAIRIDTILKLRDLGKIDTKSTGMYRASMGFSSRNRTVWCNDIAVRVL